MLCRQIQSRRPDALAEEGLPFQQPPGYRIARHFRVMGELDGLLAEGEAGTVGAVAGARCSGGEAAFGGQHCRVDDSPGAAWTVGPAERQAIAVRPVQRHLPPAGEALHRAAAAGSPVEKGAVLGGCHNRHAEPARLEEKRSWVGSLHRICLLPVHSEIATAALQQAPAVVALPPTT